MAESSALPNKYAAFQESELLVLLDDLYRLLKEGNALPGAPRPAPRAGTDGPSVVGKVIDFLQPHELMNEIDFSLGPALSGGAQALRTLCAKVIRYSVHTSHPHFCNQLYGGVDPVGLLAAWIAEALNTNMHTFEVAPVFGLCERELVAQLCAMTGYGSGGEGIFTPGGSLGNMYAMVIARHARWPHVKTHGVAALPPKIVIFTSDQAHYSIQKSAAWLGFGSDNVRAVCSDEHGRMVPQKLRDAIDASARTDEVAFMVIATAGTTVQGAIDDLEAIGRICKEKKLWFHVDGCVAVSLLFSEKYGHVLKGIELSDSLTWNPHKMLGAPLQCSMFITRHEDLLYKANATGAGYLFQSDKYYDVSYDSGDRSIQCGRKVDAFKLWLMWKARGTIGLRNLIDNCMDRTYYFHRQVLTMEGFRLVSPGEPQSHCVCFWYVPRAMRLVTESSDFESQPWWERLYALTRRAKGRMVAEGALMLGNMPLSSHNIGNCFRLTATAHPVPSDADMDYVLSTVAAACEAVIAEQDF